jgi:hypothetical protein
MIWAREIAKRHEFALIMPTNIESFTFDSGPRGQYFRRSGEIRRPATYCHWSFCLFVESPIHMQADRFRNDSRSFHVPCRWTNKPRQGSGTVCARSITALLDFCGLMITISFVFPQPIQIVGSTPCTGTTLVVELLLKIAFACQVNPFDRSRRPQGQSTEYA